MTGSPVIGVDARLLSRQRTGVERMLFNFLKELPGTYAGCTVLFTDEPLADAAWRAPHFATVVVPVRYRRLQRLLDAWIALQLPKELRAHGIDVFYAPHTKFPFARIPSVVTVHGLEWRFHGQGYRLSQKIKQWLWFRLSCLFSAGIVTFARHTESDIRRLAPRLDRPVHVVPEAAEELFRTLDAHQLRPDVVAELGVSGPYILSVCSLEPRKNIAALIRAYARVRGEIAHKLVLAGAAAWRSSRLRDLARALDLEDRVVFAGYVTDEVLIQLYNQADLFVYPSLYEGFGLPILEAMACGTPVITSGVSAMTEVAGEAAVLVDPRSEAALAAAIREVLANSNLRARLIREGRARAASFSWRETAREIVGFLVDRARGSGRCAGNAGSPAAATGPPS